MNRLVVILFLLLIAYNCFGVNKDIDGINFDNQNRNTYNYDLPLPIWGIDTGYWSDSYGATLTKIDTMLKETNDSIAIITSWDTMSTSDTDLVNNIVTDSYITNYVEDTMVGNLNITGEVIVTDKTFLFAWAGDSSYVENLDVQGIWYQVGDTNLFSATRSTNFTVTNDTFSPDITGNYKLEARMSFEGDANEQFAIRFYNVTDSAGIPCAGGVEGNGADVSNITCLAYSNIDSGDIIYLQMRDVDGTDNVTIKNVVITIELIDR